jgi:MAF protein
MTQSEISHDPRLASESRTWDRGENRKSEIILASTSPRRRELLSLLGVAFRVCPANVDETPLPDESPLETQHRITREKAHAAKCSDGAAIDEDAIVVACDTTVLLDGEMLNKPADAAEARSMLQRLRGRSHEVQSAIAIRQGEHEIMDVVSSRVVMRDYSDKEIETYIATGDPFDKAGSYGVQHPKFRPVAEIHGCPLNVMGLALCHLRRVHLPHLPDSAPVCEAFFNRPCPQKLDDPSHVVRSQKPDSPLISSKGLW